MRTRGLLTNCMLLFIIPSWATAALQVPQDYPDIASGLNAAASGDTVLVTAGSYLEHGLALTAGVFLQGESGNPSDVIIDGENLGRILLCDGLTEFSSVSGITFMRGRSSSGAAIHVENSLMSIHDCAFSDNVSIGQSGAVNINLSEGSMVDCSFTNNSAAEMAGAVRCRNSSFVFESCTFTGNSSVHSGALYLSYGDVKVLDCVFRDNHADLNGGGLVFVGTPAVIRDCTFQGNSADGGGGIECFLSSNGRVTDCFFHDNYAASNGSGIYIIESDITLTGCTMTGNRLETGGGVILLNPGTWDAHLDIDRCLIASNPSGAAIQCFSNTSADVVCSNIYGNNSGDWVSCIAGQGQIGGNLSVDPLFCDPAAGDFELADSSPCLPANNSCEVQIGAFGLGCTLVGVDDAVPSLPDLSLLSHPNPFNPSTNFTFSLQYAEKVSLMIHDGRGRLVKTLTSGVVGAGTHTVAWSGEDNGGKRVSSGVYFATLSTAE